MGATNDSLLTVHEGIDPIMPRNAYINKKILLFFNCDKGFQYSIGGFTHSMSRPCCSHAVPLPCRALIHTCHAVTLPCSDSAVSFVKVRVVDGNIRTASPTV
jgi:hypothetical protein